MRDREREREREKKSLYEEINGEVLYVVLWREKREMLC